MKNRMPISLMGVFILSGLIFPAEALLDEADFSHRAPKDTVVWISLKDGITSPPFAAKDIEGPGEELGLIGPIIARGGQGRNAYIAVYDPAGILVGMVSNKEAENHPQRLIALVQVAQRRAEIQNQQALVSMRAKAAARAGSVK